jgi:hypothetical protein
MSYLASPDANGQVTYAAGDLVDIPAGPWTVAVMFFRSGTTTDGYENLFALETAENQVITNFGTDATAAPFDVRCGQGGVTRTFTGLDDLADNDDYLFVVRKTDGTVDPRANLYRFDAGSPAWHGWVTGAGGGSFENRLDAIDHAKSHNQQGGFPLRGGIYLIAVWNDALDEAAITDPSAGLHVGIQQWVDIAPSAGPVTLLRPGETNPIVDDAGSSDETARTGTLNQEAGWPTGFNGDFGTPAQGTLDTLLNLAPALTGARRSAGTLAGGLGLAPALTGSAPARGTLSAAIALSPALSGARRSAGTLAGGLNLAERRSPLPGHTGGLHQRPRGDHRFRW